ncbi:MAG: EamA family transporter [Candidatus Wildermuthbacteria bacterium]|nr:EamA family transporter [Candidatus Wildermuthbacteria bacterium]
MIMWIPFAVLSALFAGLVAIFGKIGLAGVDTTLATAVRAVIMALFLAGVALFLGKGGLLGTIAGKPLGFIALSGIAGALSWLFYFFALRIGPATGVAAVDRLSVVFVVIFAALFLAEAFTWKIALGTILLILGALLMIL